MTTAILLVAIAALFVAMWATARSIYRHYCPHFHSVGEVFYDIEDQTFYINNRSCMNCGSALPPIAEQL